MAPTLYFLNVTEKIIGGYEIWETHMCQEKGCIMTEPHFVDFVRTKQDAQAVIDDWRVNPPLGGILKEVEWNEQPKLPEINVNDINDDCGHYSDYPEMILAMAELSGLKPYKVVDDAGRILYFTFEVDL